MPGVTTEFPTIPHGHGLGFRETIPEVHTDADTDLAPRVLELLGLPVLVTDGNGTVIIANNAAQRALRRSRAELLGQPITSVVRLPRWTAPEPGAPDTDFAELTDLALAHGGMVQRDLVAPAAPVHMVSATIRSLGGPGAVAPDGWMFTLHRITDFDDPQPAKHRTRLFDLSVDLVAVLGRDGYFIDLNPAWTTLGFSREELTTRDYLGLVHPDDRERVASEVAGLLADKPLTLSFRCRLLLRDGGHRWYRWNAVADPVIDAVLGIGVDVTEEHQATDRLHRMVRNAQEREKDLAAALELAEETSRTRTEFLASMSHELRTPLSSVIGFADLLLDNPDGNLNDGNITQLERIHRNGIHLLSLIEEVLDLAKAESVIPQVVEHIEIDAVVQEAIAQSSGAAAAGGVDVEFAPPDRGQLPVSADRKRLVQVLINLIGNAVKYSPGGTAVVDVVVDASGRAQRIDVIDDGPGIPVAMRGLVFEAFQRGSAPTGAATGRGTGLGLTIARSMCRTMGFELVLASVEGDGSTFSVLLDPDGPRPAHQPLRLRTH